MTNILLEKKGLIAVATINRPKALNALNSEVLTDLDELVSAVKADADIYRFYESAGMTVRSLVMEKKL